jgi:hypothetical protein
VKVHMTRGPRRNDVSSPAAELAPLVPISEPDPIRVLLTTPMKFRDATGGNDSATPAALVVELLKIRRISGSHHIDTCRQTADP